MMTVSIFPGVKPLFVHSDHMLDLAMRINLDAQIGRPAYSFLERLYNIFQAVSVSRRRNNQYDMGWEANQCQQIRISNARLADLHKVTPRHVKRLLGTLQKARLIDVELNGASDRLIDLSPLYFRAIEWLSLEKQRRVERERLKSIKDQVHTILAQYSCLLTAMRARYAEPAKYQQNVLEHLSAIEHLRIAYGECTCPDDFLDIAPLIANAQGSALILQDILAELRERSLGISQVDTSEAFVDKDPAFLDQRGTEMSPPRDISVPQYTTTTLYPNVNSIEKGKPALTASTKRAGLTNINKENPQKKRHFSNSRPDKWSIAWGLALKLRPEWIEARRHCRTPEQYTRWIAEHHIPVAPSLLDDALSYHDPIDVLGALVVAGSRDPDSILACHKHSIPKGRGIYAAGMLKKQSGDGRYDHEVGEDNILRPWASVFGLLDQQAVVRH